MLEYDKHEQPCEDSCAVLERYIHYMDGLRDLDLDDEAEAFFDRVERSMDFGEPAPLLLEERLRRGTCGKGTISRMVRAFLGSCDHAQRFWFKAHPEQLGVELEARMGGVSALWLNEQESLTEGDRARLAEIGSATAAGPKSRARGSRFGGLARSKNPRTLKAPAWPVTDATRSGTVCA